MTTKEMEKTWDDVDEFFSRKLAHPEDALNAALKDSTAAGLPPISVTATQGKFLAQLVQITRARRVLEVGTLGGYSTIWLARVLPVDGALISLEINPQNAAVARKNIERAGLSQRVNVVVGPASHSLAKMIEDQVEPFDLVFIDADKESSLEYFEAALALSQAGTVIVVDNVVRNGAIIDEGTKDAMVLGVRRLTDMLENDRRVSATAIQTVGSKGYDGFIQAIVLPPVSSRH